MRWTTLKAFGLAIAILVANFAILFGAVFIYAATVARGQSPDFYAAAAPRIANWTAPIGGALLFFVAGARSQRAFLVLTWAIYVMLDIGTGGFQLSWRLALSLGGALAGGLIGTYLRGHGKAARAH